jgi:hypothetical protein
MNQEQQSLLSISIIIIHIFFHKIMQRVEDVKARAEVIAKVAPKHLSHDGLALRVL